MVAWPDLAVTCHGSMLSVCLKRHAHAGGKAVGERKGLTMKERLQKCQQTERQRITFGKVRLLSNFDATCHAMPVHHACIAISQAAVMQPSDECTHICAATHTCTSVHTG